MNKEVNRNSLNSPLVLRNGVCLKNRIMKAAMSEQLANADHAPLPNELVNLYKIWSDGGAGLLMSGNIMIDRGALGEPYNIVLDQKSDVNKFKQWLACIDQKQSPIWAQLNHPGKQSPIFLSKVPVAPSAVPLDTFSKKAFGMPRALSSNEVEHLVDKFAFGAKKAIECGFSGIQIHGAHGYLISQFLSPKHNIRNDKWGGTLENRMRFLIEIYRAIRKEVGPHIPVSAKLNSSDFVKGGIEESDAIEIMKILDEEGIDLIEVSGGSYEAPVALSGTKRSDKNNPSSMRNEAYFVDFCLKIKKQLNSCALAVTGGFRSSLAMNNAVSEGFVDMVGLARALVLYPDFPNHIFQDVCHEAVFERPTTGFKRVDQAFALDLIWFEHQIRRLSKGKRPSFDLNPWFSIIDTLTQYGVRPFMKRRA
jgi:2,4-dienoyl-CoA reductase-like NADH-dependent reductase (Old Yellow Enzyme family)